MAANPTAGRRTIRVLYYDDNRDLARSVQAYLGEYHCDVRIASRLRESREALAKERFDVAVIDWVTPDRSGPELLKLLRETAPDTRRIVYSAHEMADAESTAHGAEQFVRKGADSESLRLAIERAVARTGTSLLPPTPLPLWMESFAEQFKHISLWCDRPMIGVMAPGGTLPDSLAAAITYCWRELAAPNVMLAGIRCHHWSASECEVRLLGRVVPGLRPQVELGLFDRADGVRFVLDQAEAMPERGQRLLSHAVERQSIQRVGSDSEIPTEICGIVVFESRQQENLAGPLRLAIRDSTVEFNFEASDPGTQIATWIRSLSGPATVLSPGLRAAVNSLHTGLTLRDAEQIMQLKTLWEAIEVLHGEHLGLSILERSLAPSRGPKPLWPTLKDAEQVARTYYVCRLIGETNGNITEAADLAQVSRQTLYNLIREYQIDLSSFGSAPVEDVANE